MACFDGKIAIWNCASIYKEGFTLSTTIFISVYVFITACTNMSCQQGNFAAKTGAETTTNGCTTRVLN